LEEPLKMRADQIVNWKRERDIARAIADPVERAKALDAVYDHRDDMMMECISHQSGRVKKLIETDIPKLDGEIENIKLKVEPCVESDKEYRKAKSDALAVKGFLGFAFKYGWPILKKIIEVAGPTTVAIIFCKVTGILW